MISQNKIETIGRAEKITFPGIGGVNTHARIDTGARTSAIWASHTKETEEGLEVIFFGEGSPEYTGDIYTFNTYGNLVVANSSGHTETRYTVKLVVILNGRKIRATFTLANRSTQVYPVLIGRNVLRGKFIVDVKQGSALKHAERIRDRALQSKLDQKRK